MKKIYLIVLSIFLLSFPSGLQECRVFVDIIQIPLDRREEQWFFNEGNWKIVSQNTIYS